MVLGVTKVEGASGCCLSARSCKTASVVAAFLCWLNFFLCFFAMRLSLYIILGAVTTLH